MRYKSVERMNSIQRFVEEFYFEHRRSPSINEVAKGVGTVKSTIYRYLVEMNEKGILSYDGERILTDKIQKLNNDTMSVAVLGSVSCGIPQLEEEYIEEYVTLPVSMFGKGEFYILRANGDSMIEAGINSGDLVVIRRQNEAKEGQIVVALVENENTLKRFFFDKERDCIRLHPENKNMQDIYVKSCSIQGVAVNVIKSLE